MKMNYEVTSEQILRHFIKKDIKAIASLDLLEDHVKINKIAKGLAKMRKKLKALKTK